jgi:hypothetical protein
MASNSTNESATDVATPKLTYSGLPAGSRIMAEPTAQGVTIHIPPTSIAYTILGCAFASVMLFPMTFAMISWLAHGGINHADEVGIFIFMALVLLFFWPTVIVIVWQAIRRRRVPTICTVSGPTLILITPDHPTMRHTFAIDDDLQVAAFPRGIGITLRTTGELRIAKFGERFILLRGRDYREVQWIARALNEGMGRG